MPNYWITTHWPNHEPEDSPIRNVYYKAGKRRRLPKRGDIVFIYESEFAVIDRKKVLKAERLHNGQRETQTVPLGRSAIISKAVVSGEPRAIRSDDLVLDHGNLEDWMIIPCSQRTKVKPLSKQDLMESLGYDRKAPPRFLTLWKIPNEETALQILRKLEEK